MESSGDWKILYYETIDSTNLEARRLIYSSDEYNDINKTVIVSKEQTSGKGRSGNKWQSVSGNLFFSTILNYKNISLEKISILSLIAALAVRESLEDQIKSCELVECKWPNDVMINGEKAAGILLESINIAKNNISIIIGIGVNSNDYPEIKEKEVTSISQYIGHINNDVILNKILNHISKYIDIWQIKGERYISELWYKNAFSKGKLIKIRLDKEYFFGVFIGVSEIGALQIRLEDGKIREISSGEVWF